MKNRILPAILSMVIFLPSFLLLTGCSDEPKAQVRDIVAKDLMGEVSPKDVGTDIDISSSLKNPIYDFAVELFQESLEDKQNTLVSPISVIYALGMTANGAAGNTLSQMEDVFGLPIEELNEYLYAYNEMLPSSNKYKVNIANSIWFKDVESLAVDPDFLQTNANWYEASLYKAAFDNTTLKDINSWVSDKTDGMIDKILEEISPESVMYLINAVSFDAEWMKKYNEDQIRDGVFTNEDNSSQDAKLMYSEENRYLEDDQAIGFVKYYADRKYAFVALLPDEGLKVSDYVSSLTGDRLNKILSDMEDATVYTAIPKFKYEYDIEMSPILASMGMTDAFDFSLADFSKMGSSEEGSLVINQVLHKTFISLDEKGTKAGAVTAVDMATTSAPVEIKEVYLDRPFVYMLIDCEVNMPIFMGTLMDVE